MVGMFPCIAIEEVLLYAGRLTLIVGNLYSTRARDSPHRADWLAGPAHGSSILSNTYYIVP